MSLMSLQRFLRPIFCNINILEPQLLPEYSNTPDHWVKRSPSLIALTGKHPFNAEPLPSLLMKNLITPTSVHYVRNHGAVPQLEWAEHRIHFTTLTGEKSFSMEELSQFPSIELSVFLSCDGNRRKELNMIRHSNAFNWGPAACGNSLWRGVPLCSLLSHLGVTLPEVSERPLFIHFEGADTLANGHYATSISLAYAMDPANNVTLSYKQNGELLTPDHGFPVRLLIPGMVGARSVKWLQRVWVSDKENDSYYHLRDNTVLPSHIKSSTTATHLWSESRYKLYENYINSVITSPSHEEWASVTTHHVEGDEEETYEIKGYAHGGGGLPLIAVELTLDGGLTWQEAEMEFPAIHQSGDKVWSWCHWKLSVPVWKFLRSKNISVRAWDRARHTQQSQPQWNLLGMANNCWYTVKIESTSPKVLRFIHPVAPGNEPGGWMHSEDIVAQEDLGQEVESTSPFRTVTCKEVSEHNSRDSCWVVIDGSVYDFTPYLKSHPGGWAAICAYAGADASRVFHGIHSTFVNQQKEMWMIGRLEPPVQQKVLKDPLNVLQPTRWVEVDYIKRRDVSENTRIYTFRLPPANNATLGKLCLPVGQHILLGFSHTEEFVVRPYTPIRPLNASEEDGTFDLLIKTYFPHKVGEKTIPGGKLSMLLEEMPLGQKLFIKGPTGHILYHGNGHLTVRGKTIHVSRVGCIVGGTGLTPAFQLISHILNDPEDTTKIAVIYSARSMNEVLLSQELHKLAYKHPHRFRLHILTDDTPEVFASADNAVTYGRGPLDIHVVHEHCFASDGDTVVCVCGPPPMLELAVEPALRFAGFLSGKNVFEF